MRRVLWATVVLAATVAVLVAFTIPPARLELSGADDGSVVGVLHIHTNRSDGRSSPEDVTAAAARAGLKFIVLTDHGDATRRPDPPVYRNGVLCLDGVEISTTGGHYVAIGLPAAPYPLGGEPRDVVEDVARLGGFGIAAHPDSPKRDLQWAGWDAPFDGIEIINPDTSWRVHATERGLRSKLTLLDAILTFPFRPPETIASLLVDPAQLTARWEALTRGRRVVAVSGTDAHALIGRIPMPNYETSFRMLSVHVQPEQRLSGDAAADADAIVQGLRAGHVYTTVDGFAARPAFRFSATNLSGSAVQGDELPANGPVELRIESNAPPGYVTTLWRDGDVVATSEREPAFTVTRPPDPAVYRVDIRQPRRPDLPPWLVSNPIYIRDRIGVSAAQTERPSSEARRLFDGRDPSVWRMEKSPEASGTLDVASDETPEDGGELHVRYALSAEESPDDRVALLAAPPGVLAPFDRISFTARADRPMRLSLQLRSAEPGVMEKRWQRSIYLDQLTRDHTVYFDDLKSVGDSAPTPIPSLDDVPYLLFVVDSTNAAPGAEGEFWISDVTLKR